MTETTRFKIGLLTTATQDVSTVSERRYSFVEAQRIKLINKLWEYVVGNLKIKDSRRFKDSYLQNIRNFGNPPIIYFRNMFV